MMHLGVMSHYSDGAVYPVGGSGAIPRKLNAVVLAAGGRSFTQATVEALAMHPTRRATCVGVVVNGVQVRSRVVVSSIGAYRSYEALVRPLADPPLQRAAEAAMARIERTTELTVSFMFLFLGLDLAAQPESERDERSHNTWIYPSHGAPPPPPRPARPPADARRCHAGRRQTRPADAAPTSLRDGPAIDRARV